MSDKDRSLKVFSKECGGGFPKFLLRDEGEVNKFRNWGGRTFSFRVVTRQWQHFRVRA